MIGFSQVAMNIISLTAVFIVSHEKEIFESITKLRTEYNQTKDLSKASLLNSQIDKILLIGENYPELKSSENFLQFFSLLNRYMLVV